MHVALSFTISVYSVLIRIFHDLVEVQTCDTMVVHQQRSPFALGSVHTSNFSVPNINLTQKKKNCVLANWLYISVKLLFKAAGDKLLMNKFIRQNFGGGLTLKNFIS